MRIAKIIAFMVFAISATVVWAIPFKDDFERPDGDVGNDWRIQTDGTITVEIVDNEVLISGTQATDWVRSGISRTVAGEITVFFDFLANSNFNVHLRIDDKTKGSYIDFYAWPGGPFSYASSKAGEWPGWTEIPGSTMVNAQYNNFGIEKDGEVFVVYLNGKEITDDVKNSSLENITEILLASDAANGTTGSLHIDNVIVGNPDEPVKAVYSAGKSACLWGKLKQNRR